MKKWTELIELMDAPVSIRIIVDDLFGDGFETTFEAAGDTYHFAAFLESDPETRNYEFEITFSRFDLKQKGRGKAKFDVLGDRDLAATLAVFSGVKKSLEKWLARMEEEWVTNFKFYFSARIREKSRIKLYDKLAKLIARKAKAKLTRKGSAQSIYYSFQK
jgi:hypothetical protein